MEPTLFDITFADKEVDEAIDRLVGPPYSYLKRLKLGGIGSERVEILDASPDLQPFLQYVDAPNFCNFELRPAGLLVHIPYRSQDLAWVIPYGKSSLYRAQDGLKIYCDTSYLKFDRIYAGSTLEPFLQKMMHLRATYLESIRPPF